MPVCSRHTAKSDSAQRMKRRTLWRGAEEQRSRGEQVQRRITRAGFTHARGVPDSFCVNVSNMKEVKIGYIPAVSGEYTERPTR